jgi:hypothetical protein
LSGSKIPICAKKLTKTWKPALKRSPLTPDDLSRIPFTLLVSQLPDDLHGAQTLRGAHRAHGC